MMPYLNMSPTSLYGTIIWLAFFIGPVELEPGMVRVTITTFELPVIWLLSHALLVELEDLLGAEPVTLIPYIGMSAQVVRVVVVVCHEHRLPVEAGYIR